MEKNKLVTFPRPCYGRIPNFVGAKIAGQKIQELNEFQSAKCVFSAPDASLMEVRRQTLHTGKSLLVALPHIAGYRELNGKELTNKGITIDGFKRYGKTPKTTADLFVQGSVAVDLQGNRLGKGKGYGDSEYFELKELKLLKNEGKPLILPIPYKSSDSAWGFKGAEPLCPDVKVVTIIHDCQIVDDFSALVDDHDVRVDYILTPTQIIII